MPFFCEITRILTHVGVNKISFDTLPVMMVFKFPMLSLIFLLPSSLSPALRRLWMALPSLVLMHLPPSLGLWCWCSWHSRQKCVWCHNLREVCFLHRSQSTYCQRYLHSKWENSLIVKAKIVKSLVSALIFLFYYIYVDLSNIFLKLNNFIILCCWNMSKKI